MNREIKFRGFSEELNRFVYGFYHEVEAEGVGYSYIFWQGHTTPVRADSVAQFTGMYNLSLQEIYNGDILKTERNTVEVFYGKKDFNVIFYGKKDVIEVSGWLVKNKKGEVDVLDSSFCEGEIIGNIIENPEMLLVS